MISMTMYIFKMVTYVRFHFVSFSFFRFNKRGFKGIYACLMDCWKGKKKKHDMIFRNQQIYNLFFKEKTIH